MPKVLIAGGGLAGLSAAAALGSADSRSKSSKRALSSEGARPRMPRPARTATSRDHRQLPARPVALLRQPAGFLRAPGRARPHPVLPGVLFPRARRPHLGSCAAAGCRHRCISSARSCGCSAWAAPTRLASRAPWRPCGGNGRGVTISTASACSTGCCKSARRRMRIDRFWRQVLVSAVNEELDRMAAVARVPGVLAGLSGARRFLRNGGPDRSAGAIVLRRGVEASCATCRFHLPQPRGAHRRETDSWWTESVAPPTTTSARCPSSGWKRWAWLRPNSSTRRSPASTCGSTARSPLCLMPRCSTAPCSGCSTKIAADTCNCGQRIAGPDGTVAQRDCGDRDRRSAACTSRA